MWLAVVACGLWFEGLPRGAWPEDDECVRTYSTPRRCTRCNAVLETGAEDHAVPDDGE